MKRYYVNPIIKDTATFVKFSHENDGKATELDMTLMPGGGNNLHYHKTYSETFTAVDGELGLRLGKKEKLILQPGESFTVKPNTLHSFFNPGNAEIKFKIEITPGHEGFENGIKLYYGLAEDGLVNKAGVPKKLKHAATFLSVSDINAPGLATWLSPLLKYWAKQARKSGEEKRLIAKYS